VRPSPARTRTRRLIPASARRIVAGMDRHAAYELCAQDPRLLVPFLRAIHGGDARALAEDFAGTAALSRAWVGCVPGGSAVALDLDAEALARGAATNVVLVHADARTAPSGPPADVLFVGNYSLGYLHARSELVAYLRRARERLAVAGVFVCDTYGGESAYRKGARERQRVAADGTIVRWLWEQREADPLTSRVLDVVSFRVERGGEVIAEHSDAFVYPFRLWSVPELRDALLEVGFTQLEVYADLPAEGPVRAVRHADELAESFVVCLAARG
jgi:hypothetical protein